MPATYDPDKLVITDLLEYMHRLNASDLYITANNRPSFRVDGEVTVVRELPYLTPAHTKRLVYSLLKDSQKLKFEKELELDLSFSYKGYGRFRTNVYYQKGSVAAAIRMLPSKIIPLEYLGLPHEVDRFVELSSGLILVTGPTGSGKSTTLASFIDRINEKYARHIITIEDPIEYIHESKKSIIEQREVYSDTYSFSNALKYVLRQNPDVVVIGEMRDRETVEAALNIADTGHLTFATLHTHNCAQTINRIIDIFPADKQPQIRTQLSFVLEGVICQTLVPKTYEPGRVLACEVMFATPGIRHLIRAGKVEQIYNEIQAGGKYGSQTLNYSLMRLYQRGLISYNKAKYHADPDKLNELIRMLNSVTPMRRPAPTTSGKRFGVYERIEEPEEIQSPKEEDIAPKIKIKKIETKPKPEIKIDESVEVKITKIENSK